LGKIEFSMGSGSFSGHTHIARFAPNSQSSQSPKIAVLLRLAASRK
jgi:hypothetical protein